MKEASRASLKEVDDTPNPPPTKRKRETAENGASELFLLIVNLNCSAKNVSPLLKITWLHAAAYCCVAMVCNTCHMSHGV